MVQKEQNNKNTIEHRFKLWQEANLGRLEQEFLKMYDVEFESYCRSAYKQERE